MVDAEIERVDMEFDLEVLVRDEVEVEREDMDDEREMGLRGLAFTK